MPLGRPEGLSGPWQTDDLAGSSRVPAGTCLRACQFYTYRVRLDCDPGYPSPDHSPDIPMRVWRPQPDKTLDFGLDFGGGYPEYLSGLTFAGLQYGLGHIIPVADPLLRLWEGVIRFAALSNKRPVSRKSEALVLAFSGYGISCQRGLNGFEGLPVNDGFVLPGMDPAAVKDLSHVTAIPEQVD